MSAPAGYPYSTGFAQDSDLLQAIADALGQDVATLKPLWQRIVTNANKEAFNDVRGQLIHRGFSDAQISVWTRGFDFQISQGKYWAFIAAGSTHSFTDVFIKLLDRRKDLQTAILDPGAVYAPPAGPPQLIGQGRMHAPGQRMSEHMHL